jgi:chemotaxis family two-component system sensor kinase Cph1
MVGDVPDADTVEAIARWANATGDDLVVTDCLAKSAPEIPVSPTEVSGVLGLQLPERQHILWFRREALHAVDWGGDPRAKAMEERNDNSLRLSPRKSFARWQEVVSGRSIPWAAEHVELAADLRTHAVEKLYVRSERDLRQAEALQRSLLPAVVPSVPNWSITAHYEPAEGGQIGGDWYDVMALPDDALTVVLGDVAGHGLGAAGVMAQFRNALRAYLLTTSPHMALERLNGFATRLLPEAFATAFVMCVNARTGHARAASAGHLMPYLVGPGGATPLGMSPSPPLGVNGAHYGLYEFTIAPGQGIILFSDGLIERRNERITVGLRRLALLVTALGRAPNAADISAVVAPSGTHDDATIVVLHRHELLPAEGRQSTSPTP